MLSYSTKNMIYSLVAVLALAFAWWSIMPNPTESGRRPAEIAQESDYAARQADWPIWSPAGLGEGWTPTVARFGSTDGVADWRQSWVSPLTQYVALQQAVDPTEEWTQEVLAGLQEQEGLTLDTPVGPQDWAVWTGVNANDEREVALVLQPPTDHPALTIVSGTADIPEMTTFVESLALVLPTD